MSNRFAQFEVRPVRLGVSAELGCFATSTIPVGALIWRFTGPVFTYAEMEERVRTGVERSGDDPLQVDLDLFMDVDHPAICFNHACGPNAALRGTADLFALRDIAEGEEICFDYSLTLPASNPWVMAFVCTCGAPECRGTLKNRLSVPEERVRAFAAQGALQDFMLRDVLGS